MTKKIKTCHAHRRKEGKLQKLGDFRILGKILEQTIKHSVRTRRK